MAFQLISPANALSPGDDLWIIPDPKASTWCTRLDWYMNFQVSRMLRHQSPEPPPPLQSMLKASGLKIAQVRCKADHPLLFATRRQLPNQWTLCLPFTQNLETWIEALEVQIKAMDAERVRVFFPLNVSIGQVRDQASHIGELTELTYLIES